MVFAAGTVDEPEVTVAVSGLPIADEISTMETPTPLGENRILRCLSAAELAELQPSLNKVPLVQGTSLYEPGGTIEYVYFPLAGMISLLAVMKSGQQIETGIIGRSGVAGASIGNSGSLAFGRATVEIEGSALQLSRAKFLAMFDKSATLRKLTNEFEGYLYFQAQQCAACHAVHSVEARLCRWMLQCQDITQSDVIALTQDSLSQMLGVQRNAVSLCAHKLQVEGLIQYSRGTINILNRKRLMHVACECYVATREYTERMSPPMLYF